jgi:hypothetical protein
MVLLQYELDMTLNKYNGGLRYEYVLLGSEWQRGH